MTGEQRPPATSRITDALLPTDPTPEPSPAETTTRLRAIRPPEPRTETTRRDSATEATHAGAGAPTRRAPGTAPRATVDRLSTATTPSPPAAAPSAPAGTRPRPASNQATPPPASPPRPASPPTPPSPPRPAAQPVATAPAGTPPRQAQRPGTSVPTTPSPPAARARQAQRPGTSVPAVPPLPAARPAAPAPTAPPRLGPGPAAPDDGRQVPAAPRQADGAAGVRHLPPYGHTYGHTAPQPECLGETTTRLRPVRERRTGRRIAVAVCAVLGIGLIGGSLAGVWLAAAEPGKPAEPAGYTEAMGLWHNAPVDTLFPRTLPGPGAGPGAAARTWTRIVVAPDAPCTPAVLAEGLLATLRPLGCERVLRATYTDATASSVLTVGLVFTRADAQTQRTLGGTTGLTARLGADVPPALSGPGTVAARFGAAQRASWWLSAPADLPVVVTAVSGFADGRAVTGPQPADRAMAAGRTDATAQSGLGHEAKGITVRIERLLRTTVAAAVKEKNAR
ncbi:hypothetical protein [Streptomyces lateritius]|uniref:hypothetical protein n=1 Tax=Streptomyces lateritius TaxID=67313 RepID=UPI0021AB1C01|nr:hypothetical protein [Streptomyces lateritius]